MLGNLLGFDIEAEIRCAQTRNFIRKEEREVREMERRRSLESESATKNEKDSEEGTISIAEIFQRAAESVQKEQAERRRKEEEERREQEEREQKNGENSIQEISDSSAQEEL